MADRDDKAGGYELIAGQCLGRLVADADRHRRAQLFDRRSRGARGSDASRRIRPARKASFSLPPAAFAACLVSLERYGDCVEVHRQRPTGHRRAERFRGRCEDAADRCRQLGDRAGVVERAARRTGRGTDAASGDAYLTAALVLEGLDQRGPTARCAPHPADPGVWPGSSGLALEVEQHHCELDGADAVGDRVVELLDRRRGLPSARPSTTVNSHSGRARSKPCMAIGSARSSRRAQVPCPARAPSAGDSRGRSWGR